MKTGTKHQNKNNRGKGGRETEEKEKSSKYKENQRRENMLEGRKKSCIFMPQPIEQYKSRLSLESRLLKKYKNLKKKIQSVKVKMPPKSSGRMLQRHSFYKLKACLISFDSLIHTSALPFQQSCMCYSSRHTLVHT